MTYGHTPVLLAEAITYLGVKEKRDGVWVDATLGLGGHSEAILKELNPEGRLISLDRDAESLALAKERLSGYKNFMAIKTEFSGIASALAQIGITQVDGVLYDYGVSSLHFDRAERGFSFAQEAPLDMRMDRESTLTAYDIVNSYRKEDLERVILKYGEDYKFRKIAYAIIKNRPIKTTTQLAEIIRKARSGGKPEKIHPATRVFQGIRIEVNAELKEIEESLGAAFKILKLGGRITAITFHSLEDRIVKRFFNYEATDCVCENKRMPCNCQHKAGLKVLTRKPVEAGEEEVRSNPRARSAKLRAAEKIAEVVVEK